MSKYYCRILQPTSKSFYTSRQNGSVQEKSKKIKQNDYLQRTDLTFNQNVVQEIARQQNIRSQTVLVHETKIYISRFGVIDIDMDLCYAFNIYLFRI